jgi:hypothetical protein
MGRKTTTAVLTGMSALAFATMGTGVAAAAPVVPLPVFWSSSAEANSPLLNPDQIDKAMHTTGMQVLASSPKMLDDSDEVSPAACVSAYSPAEEQSYSGTDYTAVNTQLVADGKPGHATMLVTQSVITIESKGGVGDYLTQAAKDFKSCQGQKLSLTPRDGEAPMEYAVGTARLNADQDVIILPVAANEGGCERALAGVRDTVIDVMACSLNGGNADGQAEAIVNGIAEMATSEPA